MVKSSQSDLVREIVMQKVAVTSPNRLINYGPVILVSSQHEDKRSIITLAWQMPVSHNPMLLAIAVGKTRFSHGLISESREFVINVPTWDLLAKVKFCGTHSGKNVDKFTECGFTAVVSELKTPLIQECFGNIECRLRHEYDTGDHTIFVGEAVKAWVDEGIVKDGVVDIDRVKTIHHLGGDNFAWLSKHV